LQRPAGIVEQDHATETVTGGERLQPIGNDLAEEAEDEEFADRHDDDLRYRPSVTPSRNHGIKTRDSGSRQPA
jgi:hypothetical protein